PVAGELRPARGPLSHEVEEHRISPVIRAQGLELSRVAPQRVVAMVLDQLLEARELTALCDLMIGPDEPAAPAPVRRPDDRLDRLSGEVRAEAQAVRAVKRSPGQPRRAETRSAGR